MLKAQHVPQQVNRLGQTNNELDFGRVGWTQAEKGWILIYYPGIAQHGAVSFITNHLRNFGHKIGEVSIYDPGSGQSGTEGLISNGLQLSVLAKRRFQYRILGSGNRSITR